MRVIFTANSDWNLFNYRLPLADALQEADCDVTLVCPRGDYFHQMGRQGYLAQTVIPLPA